MAAVSVGYVVERKPRRRWTRVLRRGSTPYLFLVPFLILFVLFFVLPFFYTLKLSLWQDRPTSSTFVGLKNYRNVLQDSEFIDGVKRMLEFGVVQVSVMLGLALTFSLLLDSTLIKAKIIFRLVYFIPFAVPGAIAAIMWSYIYSPNLGIIGQTFANLGLPRPDFYGDNVLLWSIANISTWEWTGYNMIILTAVLQGIPGDLYEAARIDGCNGWQVARYVKIPLLRAGLVLTLVTSIIGTLQLFQEPQVIGLVTTITDSYTPNIYAYNYAFNYGSFNYAAAISFTLAAFTFVFSYGFFRLVNRGQEG